MAIARNAGQPSESLRQACATAVQPLRARSEEVAQAIYTRIHEAVPDATDGEDPDYSQGVKRAIDALLQYTSKCAQHKPSWWANTLRQLKGQLRGGWSYCSCATDGQRCVSSASGAVSSSASLVSMPSSRDASRLVRIPTFAVSLTTGSSMRPR